VTRVHGAHAVVTGGASGIGRGIAEQLIAAGARVMISDVDADAAARTAAEIGAEWVRTDVSSLESVQELAEAVIGAFGSVDIVVNNAGVGPFARIADLTMADWHWMLDVNLYGVIHGVHVFLPILEANENGGHIVNTSSMSALTPFRTLGAYAVAKCGVSALTEVLQLELEEQGSRVRATQLVPGSVRTNIAQSTRNRPEGQSGALRDKELDLSFANSTHWLDPEDVGRITVRAIENDEPYAITHPDRWPAVAARFARIETAFRKQAASE